MHVNIYYNLTAFPPRMHVDTDTNNMNECAHQKPLIFVCRPLLFVYNTHTFPTQAVHFVKTKTIFRLINIILICTFNNLADFYAFFLVSVKIDRVSVQLTTSIMNSNYTIDGPVGWGINLRSSDTFIVALCYAGIEGCAMYTHTNSMLSYSFTKLLWNASSWWQ